VLTSAFPPGSSARMDHQDWSEVTFQGPRGGGRGQTKAQQIAQAKRSGAQVTVEKKCK
jgi:hypothetical protein